MSNLIFKQENIDVSKRGAYSASRWLSNDLRVKENRVIYTSVKEGIEYEFEPNQKGGIITFSTDVNAENLSDNKLVNWVKQKVATFNNKLTKNKKIDKISQKHNLAAWTVGKFLSGRYTAKNGKVFDEKSLSVEIIGVDSDELIKIAEELCIDFIQESVLVKDYSTNRIFLVNADIE